MSYGHGYLLSIWLCGMGVWHGCVVWLYGMDVCHGCVAWLCGMVVWCGCVVGYRSASIEYVYFELYAYYLDGDKHW